MNPPPLEYVSSDSRYILISVNPNAGRRGRQALVGRAVAALSERGLQVRIITDLNETVANAEKLHAAGDLRAVVGAGGDGTISLLANRVPPQIPLAVLPIGTENLLAKYLQTRDLDQVIAALVGGAVVRLDAGRLRSAVHPSDPDAARIEQIFLLMVSCGFDAQVIHRLHSTRSGNITQLSYGKPILNTLRTYDYPELRLYWNEEAETVEHPPGLQSPLRARWAFAFNLPCYAWGLKFTPNASGSDGYLDLCTLRRGSLWQAVKYLYAVLRQRIGGLEDCSMVRLRHLRVEADSPVPIQADGDPAGYLPMELDVLPQRVKLIVPTSWAQQHGFVQGALAPGDQAAQPLG